MSTQRRRVLAKSGLVIPANGVYIEGLDGKAYTIDKWHGGNAANSIIVASGDVKFRVALTQPSSYMQIHSNFIDKIGNYTEEMSGYTAAINDYNGKGNTANIMKLQPSTSYAAGYCNAFTFPDGKTKGFLPALGQLYIAYQNETAVNAALAACGGAAISTDDSYWSSTFFLGDDVYNYCWTIYFGDGNCYHAYLDDNLKYARPFADLT